MPLNAKGYHALVVDDEPDIRRTISRSLRAIGFTCETATDGENARKMMIVQQPDLLVTDLRMPVRHGHRLIVETMERKSPPLIAVVTGLVEPSIAYDLMSRGVADVTLKPFNSDVCAAKWLAMLRAREKAAKSDPRPVPAGETQEKGANLTEDSLASQLEQTSTALREQLREITSHFEQTIDGLEKKQENLTAGFLGSIRLLTQLMRKFDGSESTHAARVERLSEGICERVEVSRDRLRNVRLASLLHDLGQFGMPDSVRVTAPAEMTARQFEAYRHYPEIGATLLSEVPGCEHVVDLVAAHAECFDGTGFPKQLAGEQIPLGARIIRLADGVDTLVMQLGKEKGELEEALTAHLISERGRKYDPVILDVSFEYLIGSLRQIKTVLCKVSVLQVGDILDEDLVSPQGHIIARRGAVVNNTMKTYVTRIMGDVKVRVQRAD